MTTVAFPNKCRFTPRLRRMAVAAMLAGGIACSGLQNLAVGQAPAEPEQQGATVKPPSADEVFKDPETPLDSRVKPDRVTEQPLPPLPQQVILPKPPVFELSSDPSQVPIDAERWSKAREALQRGLAYLRSQQDEHGGWGADMQAAPTDQPDRPSPVSVAVTALAIKAFVQADRNALEDDRIQQALAMVLRAQQEDGSFDTGSLANYVTSSVVMALASVDDPMLRDEITQAVQWLQASQWDQSEGLSARQDWFGGAGYGRHGRPDMSNTQMMLDALYDAGLSPDEPAFQKALAFASRAQNLKATNPAPWAGNDGGFIYTPANGGESFASEAAGEGRYGENVPAGQPRSLRSYGSMTYAGFKSMLYAGLSPDDVRVRAAFDWVRNNWTFDENPGLGQQGLYYYYHTMARALTIAQQHEITDAQGKVHNWREEMIDALLARQRDDGSWVNAAAPRWEEGSPVLATIYSVLVLEEILKPVGAVPAAGSLAP